MKHGVSFEPATSKRGRSKTKFSSMEEEMAYLRAEIEYLKSIIQIYTRSDE